MKKIISVFLSFTFCFAGMSKHVFAGWGNPLSEHRELIGEFIAEDHHLSGLTSFDPKQGIPLLIRREPKFMETFGDEYREIRVYNIPCLLDQRVEKGGRLGSKSFLVEFQDDLNKIKENMPKLKKLAKKSKDLDGFLNGSVRLLNDPTFRLLKGAIGEGLAKLLNIPPDCIIMALVLAQLLYNKTLNSEYNSAAAILQILGISAITIGAVFLGSAAISAMAPTGTTGAAVVEAGTVVAETGTTAGTVATKGLLVKGAVGVAAGTGLFYGGGVWLENDGSIKQKLIRERILNYAKLFKYLMEEITNNKEGIMESNVLVIGIDKRDFADCFFWNGNRDNHGVWVRFATIKDLRCSPLAKDCKTRDGYTMEKYIEEMKTFIEGTNYKENLACFEDIKDDNKGEKDVDKGSMCVCF